MSNNGARTGFQPVGHSNPTLAFDPGPANDYTGAQQFLDLMRTMRPWQGESDRGRPKLELDALERAGVLSDDGYPTRIPAGYDKVTGIWNIGGALRVDDTLKVPFVLTYDGEGEVEIGGARILSQEEGRIVFVPTTAIRLHIHETDPRGTGDYVRNMQLVEQSKAPLLEAGAVFDPDFIALIDDARELRFLAWSDVNGNPVREWRDLPAMTGPNDGAGVHPAYQVRLANEVGADPWFLMPHLASESFMRTFATYVRDNLDPKLTARIEYSNEAWNFQFAQADYLQRQGIREWGVDGAEQDQYVKKATEMAQIWREVFADEPGRLKVVLAGQAASTHVTKELLTAQTWRQKEPGAWVDPTETFDEFGITTYFGRSAGVDPKPRNDIAAILRDKSIGDNYKAAADYLERYLLSKGAPDGVPGALDRVQRQADVVKPTGLDLVAYEGGNSIVTGFFPGSTRARNADVLD